jgi:hypothetical protein
MTRNILSGIAGLIFMTLGPQGSHAAREAGVFEQIRVDGVEIEKLDTDRVQLSVQFAAKPNRSATIRSLNFDDVSVNGMRVHVPPVTTTIHLRAGEWSDALPPIQMHIRFRDLDTLSPIRQMIGDQIARVKATMRAELQISLFQKLAIMARGIWVAIPIDQDVTVTVAGGMVSRAAAVAALYAAEPLWRVGREAVAYRDRRSDVVKIAREQVEALAELKTTFSVTNREGETASIVHLGAGLLLSNGRILTTAEMVEPWAFHPALAEALQTGIVKLTPGGLDIVVSFAKAPLGVAASYSLRAGNLRIHKLLTGSDKAVSLATNVRYKLRMRDNSKNAAMLLLSGVANDGLQAGINPARMISVKGTEQVAILRLPTGSAPNVVITEARTEGDRIRLNDPVDSLAFGSPVWIGDRVLAMMQDANSAVPIETVMKALR